MRNDLGNTRDEAPEVLDALRAASALGELLKEASNGRYVLRVHDGEGRVKRAAKVLHHELELDR